MRAKGQQGITLLEVILVLVIGSVVLGYGLTQYFEYQKNVNFSKIKYNVDQLFQAMRRYYQANCFGSYDNTGTLIPGALNPEVGSLDINNPFPVSITGSTGLIVNGFLSSDSWRPYNPLLSESTVPLSGVAQVLNDSSSYVLQFNPSQSTSRSIRSCTEYPLTSTTADPLMRECKAMSTTTLQTTSTSSQIIILNWAAQVAVKLPPGSTRADADGYRGMLDGDCVSTDGATPNTVAPCNPPPTVPSAGPFYVVWEKLPSFTSAAATSTYSQSLPKIKQFNMQYTHDQLFELQHHGTSTSYYLCGGG